MSATLLGVFACDPTSLPRADIACSFSDPKPLDKETVSTQSVSHLDPDGVVFASFIFLYRSEHQLRKMGLIKSPNQPHSASATNTPAKPSNRLGKPTEFSSLTGDAIPKGPNFFKPGSFGDFRDINEVPHQKSNGVNKHVDAIDEDDDHLDMDDLGRDSRDMDREIHKTAEDVRLEEELAARVSRVKLKRSHSNTSLKSASPESAPEESAPAAPTNPFLPASAGFLAEPVVPKEPETPAKKRKGSSDEAKTPSGPSRGLFGPGQNESGAASGFGGFLGTAMEEEEEL